jgi:hypothetical protein
MSWHFQSAYFAAWAVMLASACGARSSEVPPLLSRSPAPSPEPPAEKPAAAPAILSAATANPAPARSRLPPLIYRRLADSALGDPFFTLEGPLPENYALITLGAAPRSLAGLLKGKKRVFVHDDSATAGAPCITLTLDRLGDRQAELHYDEVSEACAIRYPVRLEYDSDYLGGAAIDYIAGTPRILRAVRAGASASLSAVRRCSSWWVRTTARFASSMCAVTWVAAGRSMRTIVARSSTGTSNEPNASARRRPPHESRVADRVTPHGTAPTPTSGIGQIVVSLRKRGIPFEYIVAPDEGTLARPTSESSSFRRTDDAVSQEASRDEVVRAIAGFCDPACL